MVDTGLRFQQLNHLHLAEGWILAPREGKTGERMIVIGSAKKMRNF
jgi:hypothetical protein